MVLVILGEGIMPFKFRRGSPFYCGLLVLTYGVDFLSHAAAHRKSGALGPINEWNGMQLLDELLREFT